MFKIESYVTPLILSYVDKYIKNIKPEDSQVGGLVFSIHSINCLLILDFIWSSGVFMGWRCSFS